MCLWYIVSKVRRYIRKIFSTLTQVFEELASKRYEKKPQSFKMLLKHALCSLDTVINHLSFDVIIIIFSVWVFFHEHSRITGLQGKGEGISLSPHYHFHPLHRHLNISRAVTSESLPLRIASSRTRAGNLWFPSASR